MLSFQSQQSLFQKSASYGLSDLNGQLIQSWKFHFSLTKSTLDLSSRPNFPLWFQKSYFGKQSFITGSESKRTFMDLMGGSRHFQLEDMKFKHYDYQSEIYFSCPEERLFQAILVANILFSPPQFGSED